MSYGPILAFLLYNNLYIVILIIFNFFGWLNIAPPLFLRQCYITYHYNYQPRVGVILILLMT